MIGGNKFEDTVNDLSTKSDNLFFKFLVNFKDPSVSFILSICLNSLLFQASIYSISGISIIRHTEQAVNSPLRVTKSFSETLESCFCDFCSKSQNPLLPSVNGVRLLYIALYWQPRLFCETSAANNVIVFLWDYDCFLWDCVESWGQRKYILASSNIYFACPFRGYVIIYQWRLLKAAEVWGDCHQLSPTLCSPPMIIHHSEGITCHWLLSYHLLQTSALWNFDVSP